MSWRCASLDRLAPAAGARLRVEVGEAVEDVSPGLLTREPSIPWSAVAGRRDHVAHRYFDTSHAIVAATVHGDLPPLRAAVLRLLADDRRRH